jgi:hypothetical protein
LGNNQYIGMIRFYSDIYQNSTGRSLIVKFR